MITRPQRSHHPGVKALDDPTTTSSAGASAPRTDWTAPRRDDPAPRVDTPRPAAGPEPDAPDAAPGAPGLREQLGRTKGAATHLVGAHVELATSEFGEILDEAKRAAIFAGAALAMLLLVGLLVVIGSILFIGEAVFGSLGWGVLHGTLLLVGVAVVLTLVALRFPAGPMARSLVIATVIGAIVAVVLGLDLTNRGWTALGDAVAGPVSADIRPLVVGSGVLAALGALVGLLLGARGGGVGGAVAGLIVGAIAGALIGALTAIALGPRVGAAIGVTIALIVWLALIGIQVARRGIDGAALKARFWPQQTIDTTKETIEWVREQAPLGPKS